MTSNQKSGLLFSQLKASFYGLAYSSLDRRNIGVRKTPTANSHYILEFIKRGPHSSFGFLKDDILTNIRAVVLRSSNSEGDGQVLLVQVSSHVGSNFKKDCFENKKFLS